jgi:dihydrofolate synthase/folylpolyglutamate synthase
MTLHPKGFDLSLERIGRLMVRLGNPHERMPPVIHIAGTNGKGSASAFCRSILEASGYSVHVHTSPHLVEWHERYRIGRRGEPGRLVSDRLLADAIERAAAANAGQPITVFEILTAAMFLLFSEQPADVAVVEVGLGGRFDATNIIASPAASLIMPIALDHQAYLGDRVELIAVEKAGIIKQERPVVIGFQPDDTALDVLTEIADRMACPLSVYGQDYQAYEEHGRMVYQDEYGLLDLPLPALIGRHQLANAAAAIRTLKAAGYACDSRSVEKGMLSVNWPGRLQRLTRGLLVDIAPPEAEIWVDGGHNPGAGIVVAEALAEMEERRPKPLVLIAGMLNTKDPVGVFNAYAGMVRHVYTVPVENSDAGIDPVALAEDASLAGLSAQPAAGIQQALQLIASDWPGDETPPRILIGGSLYLVGAALAENGTPPR